MLPPASAAALANSLARCSPTHTRSAAAPPAMWQFALMHEMGLSKPCLSYSSVCAKTPAMLENSSSRRSMELRSLISLSARSAPDASPPHPIPIRILYEHLFGTQGFG